MNSNTVTDEMIDKIIKETEFKIQNAYGKTTIVTAKLPNGFVITESSSCVDPANYDEEIGVKICKDRIKNKIWELEGYKLQDKLYRDSQRKDARDFTIGEIVDKGGTVQIEMRGNCFNF